MKFGLRKLTVEKWRRYANQSPCNVKRDLLCKSLHKAEAHIEILNPMTFFYFAALKLGRPDAANRHTLEMCRNLARLGHQIFLFVPFARSPNAKPDENIQIISVPAFHSRKQLVTTLSYYIALPWSAWPYFTSFRPQVVYSRASFLDCIAVVFLRLGFKFMYVAEVNGIRSMETTGNYAKRRIIEWLERLSIGLCDKAVAVTSELRQWAIKVGNLQPEQTSTIGNGVNVELFRPIPSLDAKRRLGLNLDLRYLTFTSSLKPWHGTQILIEALSTVIGEFPSSLRLLIVGDGPERSRMVKLAQRLGVNHAIDWVGYVSFDKVSLYINAGEICLAPFTLERNAQTGISPIKIFEYMACGRPFVTNRVEATYDELIESCRCAVLLPPNDPVELAQAIVRLLRDPEECVRMGQEGRRIAVERYSWARIAEQTQQFITQPRLH